MSHRHLLALLGVALVILGLVQRGWLLGFVWLGCDFLILGAAHAREAHRVFGKRPDGILPLWSWLLFFPLLTSTITRPLFRLPDEELVWLFDVLTARDIPGYDADFAADKRARNNAWFDIARSFGGTRYPIGSLDFSPEDWQEHYGSEWQAFAEAKSAFDPKNILTPGPGIFPKE